MSADDDGGQKGSEHAHVGDAPVRRSSLKDKGPQNPLRTKKRTCEMDPRTTVLTDIFPGYG